MLPLLPTLPTVHAEPSSSSAWPPLSSPCCPLFSAPRSWGPTLWARQCSPLALSDFTHYVTKAPPSVPRFEILGAASPVPVRMVLCPAGSKLGAAPREYSTAPGRKKSLLTVQGVGSRRIYEIGYTRNRLHEIAVRKIKFLTRIETGTTVSFRAVHDPPRPQGAGFSGFGPHEPRGRRPPRPWAGPWAVGGEFCLQEESAHEGRLRVDSQAPWPLQGTSVRQQARREAPRGRAPCYGEEGLRSDRSPVHLGRVTLLLPTPRASLAPTLTHEDLAKPEKVRGRASGTVLCVSLSFRVVKCIPTDGLLDSLP